MDRKTIEASRIERSIITGMIISDRYLQSIINIYDPDYLQTEFTRKIAGWCINYFQEFGKPPGTHIQDIFYGHEDSLEESEAELISTFLESISHEFERYKKLNIDYLLKQTEEYFEENNLIKTSEEILSLTGVGRIEQAKKLIKEHKSIQFIKAEGFNPYTNKEKIKESFLYSGQSLFKFPGALGKLMNSQLIRDALIGILAPEKRGKTWWLMEFAHRAFKSKCNVAFFQIGDLSERQQNIRFHIRLAGRSNKQKYCGTIFKPVLDCKKNQSDTCKKKQRSDGIYIDWKMFKEWKNKDRLKEFFKEHEEHEPCTYCKDRPGFMFEGCVWYEKKKILDILTWRSSVIMGRKFSKKTGKSFQLACYPSGTIKVSDIESNIDSWENSMGFIPDLIIIDYADLLEPESIDLHKDIRHQQNTIWKSLRSLSIKRNCLVITATQADAASYQEESLKLINFSESKSKYAHVTCFIALNQTAEEKRMGIMRIGQLVVREDEFDIDKEVKVLQCLNIGRPFISSFF